MILTVQSPQGFAIVMFIFAFIGFIRGWRIELVSMGFTIAAILFLLVGGAYFSSQFLFVFIPKIVGLIIGSVNGSQPPSLLPPNVYQELFSAFCFLVLAMVLANVIGKRLFPAKINPVTTKDHFLGVIPGLFTGYTLITYFNHIFAGTSPITFGLNAPSPNSFVNYILVLFFIISLVLVVSLLVAKFGK